MPESYQFSIPRTATGELHFTINCGSTWYILGPNGSGKSSLISRLFHSHQSTARRIAAHRQNWFHSNTLDMTPRSRDNIESAIRSHDAQQHSRYRLDYAQERAGLAIFDLIDADAMLARKIAELVRADDIEGARREASSPSPLATINALMLHSNLPIEIGIQERERVTARKRGGPPFSVAELSDGERNAFLIAADVLTAKPGTLLLIDEPERHLHRSIIAPLLSQLFSKRNDCAFVISTHDVALPLSTEDSATLLVRDCEYDGNNVRSWTIDLMDGNTLIDDSLKTDILGSRKDIIFVEGAKSSLDLPLYSALYPFASIIPKSSCKEVEHAVRGLRAASDLHWVHARGIVDSDQRTPDEIRRLSDAHIYCVPFYSIEALYYHKDTITSVACRQAAVIGGDAAELVEAAMSAALEAVRQKRTHLINSSLLRNVRRIISRNLPHDRSSLSNLATLEITVDVASERSAEETYFDNSANSNDWNAILMRYPVRESAALDRIAEALRFADKRDYQSAVVKLVYDEEDERIRLRSYFPQITNSHAS